VKKIRAAGVGLVIASFALSAAAARDDQVEVRGCAVDPTGAPARNAMVDLSGSDYEDKSTTDHQGRFVLHMKKGTKERAVDGTITVWNLGFRVKERGGWGETKVRNNGATVSLRDCVRVSGAWFIGARIVGLDEEGQPRTFRFRLRLKATEPVQDWDIKTVERNGLMSFDPLFAEGQHHSIELLEAPDDGECFTDRPDGDTVKPGGKVEYTNSTSISLAVYAGYTITCKPDKTKALVKKLRDQYQRANEGRDAYYTAVLGLRACGEAKDSSDRQGICGRAQKDVADCNAYRASWEADRATLADRGRAHGLADLTMPPCASVIEATGLTPAQQLELWAKEESGPAQALTRPGRGGAALLEAGRLQAEQDERDRPARRAREQAEQERLAAEERRLEAERAELQRRYEREQAEASERRRTELMQALGVLSAEIEKNRRIKAEKEAERREAERRADERRRQAAAPPRQSGSGAPSQSGGSRELSSHCTGDRGEWSLPSCRPLICQKHPNYFMCTGR
jgi:hypothetical protein